MPTNKTVLRKFSKDGPEIPALGFGLISLAGFYGSPPDSETRFAVLNHALDIGETFWDSSECVLADPWLDIQRLISVSIYGDSEAMIGEWFKRTGKRNQILLATKFGIKMQDGKHSIDSTAKYCKEACKSSLKKLGVDSIDLCMFYQDWVCCEAYST